MRRRSKKADELKVGCLFVAIGGFCRAFQTHGARVAWANEKDDFAASTFRHNFSDVRLVHKDIRDLSVRADKLEPVDILTAGFPCQPFSIAGEKRGFDDKRGTLFLEIIRILNEFGDDRPKLLLLENVSNFRGHDDGRTFRRVKTEIQKAGYWFTEQNSAVLNTATHTRIPQNRARLFMVAVRSDQFQRNTFDFPEPLPEGSLESVWSFLDSRKKHDPVYYFTEESQYYSMFKDAIEKYGRKSVYQLRRNYVRENKRGLCFTLMANMGGGGHNQPVISDRWGIRKLTERECARLQGYDDDWFDFPDEISRSQKYKQIGNSVTVPLIERLAATTNDMIGSLRGNAKRPVAKRRKRA